MTPQALSCVGLAAALLAAGCGPSAAQPAGAPAKPSPASSANSSSLDPALQRLVDGARAEGTVSLVWSDSSLGGAEGAQRMVEAINRKYGLQLNLVFTPGPSMPEMAVRMTQEQAAGRPATSDVFLGREANIKSLIEHSALLPIDWPALSPYVTPAMVAPENVAVEVAVVIVGVTYNPQLIPADRVPRTTADLLRPEWKGRFATPPYPQFLDVLGSPEVWGTERTIAFTRELAANAGGLMRCGETERIISGEFLMLAFDCGSGPARIWAQQGAPVRATVMQDAAALVYYYLGVPNNAAHPNAATLFVLEAMTPDAQKVVWDIWGHDHPKIPGGRSAQEVADAEARGAKFVEANVQFMMSYPDQELVRRQTQAILNQTAP